MTNKHVVYSREKAHFPEILTIHIPIIKSGMTRAIKTHRLKLYDRKTRRKLWQTPNDPRVDIVAINVDIATIKIDVNEKIGFVSLSNKDTLPKGGQFIIGSPTLVLGFPESPEPNKIQFYDEVLNFPVARFATIATLPQFPFNKERYFLVDAKLHPGMSGSPVASMPRAIYTKDDTTICDDVNSYLVGILSAGWPALELNAVWPAQLIEEAIQTRL